MGETVKLKLVSELGEDEIELPKDLWVRFEDMANETGTPPEQLFEKAIDAFLKKQGY